MVVNDCSTAREINSEVDVLASEATCNRLHAMLDSYPLKLIIRGLHIGC